MADFNQPIIVKKVKKGGHAHHGGAWKIAYADFVTAMMAFFLLLWLISMTTPEQKKGLSDYFAPTRISESTSGGGGFMGGKALDDEGAKTSGPNADIKEEVATPPKSAQPGEKDLSIVGQNGQEGNKEDSVKSSQIDIKSQTDQAFHSAAASIRQAWQAMPEVTDISENLLVEETPEGLNITIMDQAGRPMFPEGSKYPFEVTRKAIAAVAPILQKLPNQVSISGHTAAGGNYPNPQYGPWQLSSDRANVVRSILAEFGLSDDHIDGVTGRSTAEPFFPNDPYMAANERVKITVLYGAPPVPAGLAP